MSSLLFGRSSVRREILERFLSQPALVRHASALAREIGRKPEVAARELRRLERAGIVVSEEVGRARRYRANTESPFWHDFARLAQRTIGVEARLRRAFADVPGVDTAFLFGSYARGDERPTSDLDVLVIGDADPRELRRRLMEAEHDLGRDVNLVHYRRDELRRRMRKSAFVQDVLSGAKVVLLGDPSRAVPPA